MAVGSIQQCCFQETAGDLSAFREWERFPLGTGRSHFPWSMRAMPAAFGSLRG